MIGFKELSLKQITAIFVLSFFLGCILVYWYQNNVLREDELLLGVDIYPRWVGTRAFWEGQSPYSPEVERIIQDYVYGRPAQVGEDNFGFYYLPHAAIVLAPLALMPAKWASLFWVAFLWATLSIIIFILMQNFPDRPSKFFLAAVILTVFLYKPFLIGILNGQYLLFVLAIWGLTYFLARRDHNALAGFLLVLSSIKPTLSLFPILVFLLWFFSTGRYKAIISFTITSMVMILITFIQIGWWLPDFLTGLSTYNSYVRQWASSDVFSIYGLIWSTLTIVLLFLGIQAYWRNKKDFPWILFWGASSLVLLVSSHTSEYDFPLLVLPFIMYAPYFWRTKLGTAVWFLIMWLPWLVLNVFADYTGSYNAFWLHQPQIVVLTLLFFLYFNRETLLSTTLNEIN